MIKVNEVIITEGKYDKIKLKNIIDGIIITTDGFGIFKNKEKQQFIKMLAETKGIIIMTDSDFAGFKIRNYIKNITKNGKIINVYIPDVPGKEKRKSEFSKEGKLGVEGISEKLIIEALKNAGITGEKVEKTNSHPITASDLYEDKIIGCNNSKEKKYKLLEYFSLPKRLSTSSMLEILNTFISYDDYKKCINEIISG